MDFRKKETKKGINADDARRRRAETTTQLRKDKKEEGVAKRRNLLVNNFTDPNLANVSSTEASNVTGVSQSDASKGHSVSDIPILMQKMQTSDVAQQISALRGFRRLLSTERNPPVQQCIDCGAIPMFVSFLQRADNVELQFEAAWALTNIASTDRTRLVVECGAIPYMVQLLRSPNPDVREQSAWCLGNVAGDGAELRDVALACGALSPLVANVAQPANITLLRNCTWALSNFCRGKPQPHINSLTEALPVLGAIINSKTDQETTIDATWALSYISDGDNARIQHVVNQGVISSLVSMLGCGKATVIVPSLRTLGNIVSGSDAQTQAVVEANVLPALVALLPHSKKNIRKEACWMLSNIAAGNADQLNLLVNTPDLISNVLSQLSASAEWDVRKEATWIVSNIATGGSKAHINRLIEHGVVRPLCDLLDVGEVRILIIAMEALEAILKSARDTTALVQMIEESEGIDKLETLQEHENQEVYDKAVKIIEKYFGGEEEEGESENAAPVVGSNGTYAFGMPATSFDRAATKVAGTFEAAPTQVYDFGF